MTLTIIQCRIRVPPIPVNCWGVFQSKDNWKIQTNVTWYSSTYSSSHGNDFATKFNTVTNLFRDLADCGWKTSNEIMDERLDTSFFPIHYYFGRRGHDFWGVSIEKNFLTIVWSSFSRWAVRMPNHGVTACRDTHNGTAIKVHKSLVLMPEISKCLKDDLCCAFLRNLRVLNKEI